MTLFERVMDRSLSVATYVLITVIAIDTVLLLFR